MGCPSRYILIEIYSQRKNRSDCFEEFNRRTEASGYNGTPPHRSEINNAIDASKPCLGIVASGWSSMPRQRQIQRGRDLSKPGGPRAI